MARTNSEAYEISEAIEKALMAFPDRDFVDILTEALGEEKIFYYTDSEVVERLKAMIACSRNTYCVSCGQKRPHTRQYEYYHLIKISYRRWRYNSEADVWLHRCSGRAEGDYARGIEKT